MTNSSDLALTAAMDSIVFALYAASALLLPKWISSHVNDVESKGDDLITYQVEEILNEVDFESLFG